jgi:hypothetical protein
MAQVEIRDTSLWTTHIRGDASLKLKLESLRPGERVQLRVAGIRGPFEKMKDGPNGPMPGLKPVGEAKDAWRKLYPRRRGEFVEVALEESEGIQSNPAEPIFSGTEWSTATDAEREAAWNAFMALTRAGWRSEASASRRPDRDELHRR